MSLPILSGMCSHWPCAISPSSCLQPHTPCCQAEAVFVRGSWHHFAASDATTAYTVCSGGFITLKTCCINKEDRAYFPTSRDIHNHIHSALVAGQYSGLDEDNFQHKVGEWKKNDSSASFFLRFKQKTPYNVSGKNGLSVVEREYFLSSMWTIANAQSKSTIHQ